LPLSQTRLHPVERRRQRAKVIILNNRQTLTVITSRHTLGSFGKVADGSQRLCERGADATDRATISRPHM
jgi:hypothetical protein